MTDELSTDYGCSSLHICSLRQFYRRDSSTHPQSVQSLPTQKASFLRTPCSKRSTNKQQWAARGQQKSKQGTHNVNKRYKANKVESKKKNKQATVNNTWSTEASRFNRCIDDRASVTWISGKVKNRGHFLRKHFKWIFLWVWVVIFERNCKSRKKYLKKEPFDKNL